MKHTQRNSCVQSSIDTSTDPSSKFILDDSGNSEPAIRHGDHCDVRDRSTEPGTGRTRRINSETQPKTDQGNKVTKLSLQPTAGHKDDPASFARPRQPSERRPLRVRTARNTAWITATTLPSSPPTLHQPPRATSCVVSYAARLHSNPGGGGRFGWM